MSGRVPLTVSRSSPRSVCLESGVQHRAPVQLSNTVSQVLARPSEWLELFKASRKRDAFFLCYRRTSKSAAFIKRPFACNKVCRFWINSAAPQQFWVFAITLDGQCAVRQSEPTFPFRRYLIRPTVVFLASIKPVVARFQRLPPAPMRPRYRALLRPSCFQSWRHRRVRDLPKLRPVLGSGSAEA